MDTQPTSFTDSPSESAQSNLSPRLEASPSAKAPGDRSAQMSQALNDLLAALPEMFPGDQEIPLKNIRPNPDNPGPPITEQEIQDLAENLKERGLLNPIRV